MTDVDRVATMERILVALDASGPSLAALEAAAQLAAAHRAEIHGLFVEDRALLRLADAPLVREVGYASASRRAIGVGAMERSLRAVAAQARRALAAAAEASRLRWEFRVARGSVVSELLGAAATADLVVLGRVSRADTQRRRLGSTAREVLAAATGSVLLQRRPPQAGRPILLVYDASLACRRALALLPRLQRMTSAELVIVIPAVDATEARRLEREAAGLLGHEGVRLRARRILALDPAELLAVVRAERAGLLVLARVAPLSEWSVLEPLLEAVDTSVLLVG